MRPGRGRPRTPGIDGEAAGDPQTRGRPLVREGGGHLVGQPQGQARQGRQEGEFEGQRLGRRQGVACPERLLGGLRPAGEIGHDLLRQGRGQPLPALGEEVHEDPLSGGLHVGPHRALEGEAQAGPVRVASDGGDIARHLLAEPFRPRRGALAVA
ncbi:hypothetical protein ACFQFG_04195 [Methylobacterium persicinum]